MCLQADRQWLDWGHLKGFLTHMPGSRLGRLIPMELEKLGLHGHLLSLWSLHTGPRVTRLPLKAARVSVPRETSRQTAPEVTEHNSATLFWLRLSQRPTCPGSKEGDTDPTT